MKSIKAHDDIVEEVTWHPTNPNILASTSYDKFLKIWDIRISKLNVITEMTNYENNKVKWNFSGNNLAICKIV